MFCRAGLWAAAPSRGLAAPTRRHRHQRMRPEAEGGPARPL